MLRGKPSANTADDPLIKPSANAAADDRLIKPPANANLRKVFITLKASASSAASNPARDPPK